MKFYCRLKLTYILSLIANITQEEFIHLTFKKKRLLEFIKTKKNIECLEGYMLKFN